MHIVKSKTQNSRVLLIVSDVVSPSANLLFHKLIVKSFLYMKIYVSTFVYVCVYNSFFVKPFSVEIDHKETRVKSLRSAS